MWAARELKKLNRMELLEMLVELSEENEKLKAENDNIRAKLEDRAIQLGKTGNIAEASLKLSGVFEAAQAAADQYLENIKRLSGDSQGLADSILAQARAEAADVKAASYKTAQELVDRTKAACAEYTARIQGKPIPQQSYHDEPEESAQTETSVTIRPSHAATTATKTKKRKGSFIGLF